MQIGQYRQRQRCKHVELEQFLADFHVARVCQRQLGFLVNILTSMFYSRTIKICHHSNYITWPKVQVTTWLVYISLEMKHQIGELGDNILVHTNSMDITMHGRRLARMWRRVWVVLHCTLFFAWALGGQLPLPPPPPLKWRPCRWSALLAFTSRVHTSLKLKQNTETTWNSFSVCTSWNWNKTKLSTVGWNEAPPSAVLFYFSFKDLEILVPNLL